MKTPKLLLTLALLITIQSFGQRRYLANRYFEDFAYVKSAELYKELIQDGDTTKRVLQRLADSYYFNSEMDKAEKWYQKLITNYKSYVEPEYLFKYAKTLKSNGKYKESDDAMKAFKKLQPEDTRYENLELTPNYVNVYSDTVYQKKKKEVINVHNVALNTKYSDFGGFIYEDNFYFSSSAPSEGTNNRIYRWNEQPYLDIFIAKKEEQTLEGGTDKGKVLELTDKVVLDEPVQTKFHEANAILTKDGLTMYFTRDNYNGKKLGKNKDREVFLKIYKARLINGKWDNITELPFNSNDFSIGHPALSPNEKELYFISDMPNGYGSTDLYKVSINGNTYGEPENLGKNVNTEGREMFPYMSKDSVLYFSSDGHLGLGALDIFETKLTKDKGFSEVKNIHAPFNSKMDDFGFTTNKEKNKGFFSSNRKGGKGDDDIYSFIVASCTQTITGVITNVKTGDPISGALVEMIDTNGKKVDQFVTKENGKYKFLEADCGESYTVKASKETFAPNQKTHLTSGKDGAENTLNIPLKSLLCSQSISGTVTEKRTGEIIAGATVKLIESSGRIIEETTSDSKGNYMFSNAPCKTSLTVQGSKIDYRSDQNSLYTTTEDDKSNDVDLVLTALIVGNQIVINPIFFDYDKYNIREDAAFELENIVTVMNNNPKMVIKIEAHTDSRGKKAYNRLLSDRRAKSTGSYIISRGISANRIESAIGFGEDQLLNKCSDGVRCSKEEHQENRRSYFYIVSGGKNIDVKNQKK